MFQRITPRLRLIPLSLEQLYLFSAGRDHLDRSMGFNPMPEFTLNTSEDMLSELESAITDFIIPGVTQHSDKWEWHTHWVIVHDRENLNIGGIGMAGGPDENGQAYLGYYMEQGYEGKGYMTEALAAMLEWMFSEPLLLSVMAETRVTGYASQRVLMKNRFEAQGPSPEGIKWVRYR